MRIARLRPENKRQFGNDDPMRRNATTTKDLKVGDERDRHTERERLVGLIDRFVSAGPAGCTTHPHSFFGRLTPVQWATSRGRGILTWETAPSNAGRPPIDRRFQFSRGCVIY